jgi:hypothetical protein
MFQLLKNKLAPNIFIIFHGLKARDYKCRLWSIMLQSCCMVKASPSVLWDGIWYTVTESIICWISYIKHQTICW